MKVLIGIRREDKNIWERRVPLVPEAVERLQKQLPVQFLVQRSPNRIFPDELYARAGARLVDDLDEAGIVFAVKEIPVELLRPRTAYLFFSHTIKGQEYNMPLLRRLLELETTLIDYERIVDEKGRRLVFFGRHAGYAGMIDTLHALGQRWAARGRENPFTGIQSAYQYESLDAAREVIRKVGAQIAAAGLPAGLTPLVVGFAGYGNVSQGAQWILDLLPVKEMTPEELLATDPSTLDRNVVYKVVFKEEHLVERLDGSPFRLQTYYDHPELFRGVFQRYLPHLDVLVNAIFWNESYPRLVTKAGLRELYAAGQKRLQVIGDISIDIEGSIECSYKATYSDAPTYVYEPLKDSFRDGVEGDGPVIMAVDNLPCEISRESSLSFSEALEPFVPRLVAADWNQPWEKLELPAELRRAVIVHQGRLTPDYRYLQDYLPGH